MNKELKPCPFCGGEAEIVHNPREDRISPYYVSCTECLASTATDWDKEEAIEAWNRREPIKKKESSYTERHYIEDFECGYVPRRSR